MKSAFLKYLGSSHILICFLVAIAFHALMFTFYQLKRGQALNTTTWRSHDNTPELLQFSSAYSTSAHENAGALPKASILPPPYSTPQSPSSVRRNAHRSQRGGKALLSSSKRDSPTKTVRPPKLVLHRKQLKSKLPSSSALSVASRKTEFLKAAVEYLRRSIQETSASAMGSPTTSSLGSSANSDETLSSEHIGFDPMRQDSLRKLWERAEPQEFPLNLISPATSKLSIEIRKFSSPDKEQGHFTGLDIHHRKLIMLNDQIWLFWLEDRDYWILRTQLQRHSL